MTRIMKKINTTVYVPLATDVIHEGHLNIIKKANKLGQVIIGILSDKAITQYKQLPLFSEFERIQEARKLKNVNQVIVQNEWSYKKILKKIKPNYFIHGDDWKKGIQKKIRSEVIETLKKTGGKLVEVQYTKGISGYKIKKKLLKLGISPDHRKSLLRRLINSKEIVRIIESHSALTALIVDRLSLTRNKRIVEFDGLWSSSLTDSTLRGKPDNQSLDYTVRINSLSDILDVTHKPIIFDGDNGGRIEHLDYLIKNLERNGVSAIVIEDKKGLKLNSLFKNQDSSQQESIGEFCKKIKKIIRVRISKDFLVIARIESFILNRSENEALMRATKYAKAGADGILIHSKNKNPKEIIDFAKKFRKIINNIPLVAVPSTYSRTYEKELIKNGFKIIIYANQLLRSSYKSMSDTAKSILKYGRSYEAEKKISSINELINLIK